MTEHASQQPQPEATEPPDRLPASQRLPWPPGVRPARPADRHRLLAFLRSCALLGDHIGGIDWERVQSVIDAACWSDAAQAYVVALIDGPRRIEAAVGLHPGRQWFGDDKSWGYSELFFNVHPAHRRSRHAQSLLRWVQCWREQTGFPVMMGLLPSRRYEAKCRLFERYGREVGRTYLIGAGSLFAGGGNG